MIVLRGLLKFEATLTLAKVKARNISSPLLVNHIIVYMCTVQVFVYMSDSGTVCISIDVVEVEYINRQHQRFQVKSNSNGDTHTLIRVQIDKAKEPKQNREQHRE